MRHRSLWAPCSGSQRWRDGPRRSARRPHPGMRAWRDSRWPAIQPRSAVTQEARAGRRARRRPPNRLYPRTARQPGLSELVGGRRERGIHPNYRSSRSRPACAPQRYRHRSHPRDHHQVRHLARHPAQEPRRAPRAEPPQAPANPGWSQRPPVGPHPPRCPRQRVRPTPQGRRQRPPRRAPRDPVHLNSDAASDPVLTQ
jgi:hypothetical protein